MTLLAGYFRAAGALPEEPLAERLRTFRVLLSEAPSPDQRVIHRFPLGHVVAIAGLDTPEQDLPVTDGLGNLLAVHGYLLPEPGTTAAELLRAALDSHGKSLEAREGEFAAVLLDSTAGEVHLVNDWFAARPFYIYRSGDLLAFTSSPALLRHWLNLPLQANPFGWAQMLAHSHTLSPTTTFAGLTRMLPGSHVTLSRSGVQERQYWRLKYDVATDTSPEELAETAFAAFEQSTQARARMAGRVYVPLSGGLDSRIIAACTPRDVDCRMFTYNKSLDSAETAEVIAARKIAAVLGWKHEVLPLDDSADLASQVPDILWTRGAQKLVHHCVGGELIGRAEFDHRLRLNGSPGDVLAGSYPPEVVYLNPARTEEMLASYYLHYLRHLTPWQALHQILRPELVRELAPRVEAEMQRTLAEVDGPTAAHKVTGWAQLYRQPGFTLISRINNLTTRADACPHLGYDYCRNMLRLPAAWLYQRNFYQYLIYRQLPALREIEYANTGRPLDGRLIDHRDTSVSNVPAWKRLAKSLLRNPALRNMRERLRGKQEPELTIPPTQASTQPVPLGKDFHYDLLQQDSRLLEQLTGWIRESSTAKELLDIPGCLVLLASFRERRPFKGTPGRDRELVGALVTLCLGQELVG